MSAWLTVKHEQDLVLYWYLDIDPLESASEPFVNSYIFHLHMVVLMTTGTDPCRGWMGLFATHHERLLASVECLVTVQVASTPFTDS